MAKTKTTATAITRANSEFHGITVASSDGIDFANEINTIMLTGAYWDFMTKSGTAFGTTLGTQDYSNVPSDFLWMKGAWLQDDSSSTNPQVPLTIKDALPLSAMRGRPRSISVELGTKFRLFPVPNQTRSGSGPWLVSFEYYKLPTRIAATSDTFEFDDVYYETFIAGFLARVGSFINDEEAGVFQGRDSSGMFRGTGLWGKFAGMLNMAIASENQASQDPVCAPTENLELG